MLKAAIEKIQELCAPNLFQADGHNFLAYKDGGYTEVKPDLEIVENIHLSSLDALVKFVKTEAVKNHGIVYICITRQLKQMDMKDLREAYTAICKISDRGKDTTPM